MKWTLLLFQTVSARGWSTAVGSGERVAGMLDVAEGEFKSLFAWVKQPARRATWSRFRAHAERMEKVDGLGDSVFWVGKTPPAKVAALAEQARVLSVGEMKDIAEPAAPR